MKKTISLIFIFILLLSMTPVSAAPQDELRIGYWEYNDDFTKITVDGKTYDNIVLLIQEEGKTLFLQDLSDMYLLIPEVQTMYTPDHYYDDIEMTLRAALYNVAEHYPFLELIEINHEPWQNSEYAHIVNEIFSDAFSSRNYDDPEREALWNSIIKNPANNGSGYYLSDGKTPPASSLQEVAVLEVLSLGNSDAVKDSGYWDSQENMYSHLTPVMATLDELKEGKIVKKSSPEPGIQPPVMGTSIVLKIDDPAILLYTEGEAQEVTSDVAPYIQNSRTLIPLRIVSELMGAEVTWKDEVKSAVIDKGSHSITMTLNNIEALVGSSVVLLDTPPEVNNGRIMVPLRFVSEQLNYETTWNPDTKTITIK